MNLVYSAKVSSENGLTFRASAGSYVSLTINDQYIQTIAADQAENWNVYPSIFNPGDVVLLQAGRNNGKWGPGLTARVDGGAAVSPVILAAVAGLVFLVWKRAPA